MKKRVWWMGTAGVALLIILSAFLLPLNKKEQIITEAVNQFLTLRHYQPLEINDNFSEKVFNHYLKQLDLNKRYLLQSDVDRLAEYKDQIDDEWMSRDFQLFEDAAKLMNKRLLETKTYFTRYLSKPFDLSINETVETDPDKRSFPKNQHELEEAWRKALKLQVMMRVANNLQSQQNAALKSDTVTVKSTAQLETEARKGLLDNYNDWYIRVKNLDRNDQWSVFINSVISVYDPHSWYMPPRDQERFNVQMAGKYEGIGATLRQKDGYLMVVDMFPGSPSWRSKQIEVNDLIMRVAQAKKPYVDILDMKMERAVEMIKGPKGTQVRLEIKKRDGSIHEVVLTRDVIILEESYASSLMLQNGKRSPKIGYIYLPKFYLDFQDRNGRKCSEDVKKEIAKLQAEGAKGIIFDLRNNGGGSLPEAVKLAGLFIPRGPVVQVKSRVGPPRVLSDTDPRTQYNGPLVVITNYSSASASEIFAGAMQDYGRGLIIGSHSTWGKGSVQRVANLDAFIPSRYDDIKPLGALSLTIQKFYRISGGSTQLKGVTPDIILPDANDSVDVGEKEQENPLPWDKIQKAPFAHWPVTIHKAQLRAHSAKRVSKNRSFQLVRQSAERLKQDARHTLYTLNLEQYMTRQKTRQEENKKFTELLKKPTGLQISSLEADRKLIQQDTAKQEIAKRMIEDLGKDFYLSEAEKVMEEMIGKRN